MTKRAVVVGVNDYSVQGFTSLNGCVRDASAMYHTLIDAFGFDADQVYCYLDRQASSSRILQALNWILRVSEPGDVACLYYAGHGGLHPSGTPGAFYQTIIPHSGRFITDWDLWQAAAQLQPAAVNFTVILDSCHSGGMVDPTEATESVRTIANAQAFLATLTSTLKTVVPFGVTAPDIETWSNNVHQIQEAPQATVCYTEEANREYTTAAKATLLAACRWDEYAGENASHGFLTNAILSTVNASNFTITHQELHSALTPLVHEAAGHEQHPVLRGQANRMDGIFLRGFADSR
ncbi:MAG: caspase family protein [Arachnia sp.]